MAVRIIAVILLCALAASAIYVYQRDRDNAAHDETSARQVVTQFGDALKDVSLLAPQDTVREEMDSAYGGIVDPALITSWLRDPQHAPGRLTSSPWPQGIEIASATRIGSTTYRVDGSLIDVSNEGGGIDEEPVETGRRPISLTLESRAGRWIITAVTPEATPSGGTWIYSQPDSQGMQFLYPQRLDTRFINTPTDGWPPRVALEKDATRCTGEEITIGDHTLCRIVESEGAAGTTYRTFTYRSSFGNAYARVSFVLGYPQCPNFDEPERSACTSEEARFDVDGLADRIMLSIKVSR